MIKSDSRIKLCPKCGNKAVLIHNREKGYHVCCKTGPTRQRKECKLYIGYEADGEVMWFSSAEVAIEFWNDKAEGAIACD